MGLDVRTWLEAGGFGPFADLFESRQIDGDVLPLLTDAHLKELGVPLGARIRMLAAIARLGADAREASAERRRLTVMFVDLVGSTALSSRLDPEELRDLIRAYHQSIAAEVARHDAYVAQYLGDGALVYFGYPRAHEDDAERAVRAALDIVRAVAGQRDPTGEPLAVHVGIATGLVVVGDPFEAGAATERAVVGETPNLAARLVGLAAPGEIVVSAQTRALIGGMFEVRDLGPQSLKGLPSPVVAYAVTGERATETRFEAHRGMKLTALVGRDAELELLAERWRQAAGGSGQVVLLTGEAGIGKSRLVREFEVALAAEPHLRITNQCSPRHADSALYPVIRQLTRAAGIGHGEGAEAQLDRLDALLAGAGSTDRALVAALLGIDGSRRHGPLDIAPEQQRARTFEALLNRLERLSLREPVLWVLEDAHWIDPTTMELVANCVDRVAGLRVLVVVTARPDFAHRLPDGAHVSRVALGRLGRRQVLAMVGSLARGTKIPEPVLGEIATRTDGVPLFVEELTKAVLEAGMPAGTGSGTVPDGPAPQLAVPATLHDSMMARLDRLESAKEVAQNAACIGREFDFGLLLAICGLPAQLLRERLERLEEAQIVFRSPAPHEEQFTFKHALVRDAAYESLLKAKRQQIHARILGGLEKAPDTPPEVLAWHAAEAGLAEKAIDCWQAAGTLAIARPAYEEAISHIAQALQLAERMEDSRQWRERRLQLLLLLGQATIPLRGYSHGATVAVFERARSLIETMGDAPHAFSVAYAMWVAHYVRGEHPQALEVAHRMLEQARAERSDSRMLTALRALGIGKMIVGELALARSTFEGAQRLARIVHEQPRERRLAVAHRFAADPEIATQFHVALTLWALGHMGQARELVARTVSAARAMGHAHTLGHALAHGAIFAAVARETQEALSLSEETMAFADEHDMDLWRGYGAILHGHALVLAGRASQAIVPMERGFALLERTQTGTMVPAHHAIHAFALASLGRFDEASREVAIVQGELQSGSERYFWPHCLRWLGDSCRLAPGDGPSEAQPLYARGLALAREQGARSWELVVATGLARLLAEDGDGRRAAGLLEPLLADFAAERDCAPVHEARALLD